MCRESNCWSSSLVGARWQFYRILRQVGPWKSSVPIPPSPHTHIHARITCSDKKGLICTTPCFTTQKGQRDQMIPGNKIRCYVTIFIATHLKKILHFDISGIDASCHHWTTWFALLTITRIIKHNSFFASNLVSDRNGMILHQTCEGRRKKTVFHNYYFFQ